MKRGNFENSKNWNLFEETREKKIKENNYYDIDLIKEIRSIININKYSHDDIVYRLSKNFVRPDDVGDWYWLKYSG